MAVTKRLVAHVPAPPEDDDCGYGPSDGDPVGVPAPCSRLAAGYWCSCGSGFVTLHGYERVTRARVELDPGGDWRGFVDTAGDFIEPGMRWPTESDRQDLQAVVESMPVGTVVERFGAGIARGFHEDWADGLDELEPGIAPLRAPGRPRPATRGSAGWAAPDDSGMPF